VGTELGRAWVLVLAIALVPMVLVEALKVLTGVWRPERRR
jgi:hypothetical protein